MIVCFSTLVFEFPICSISVNFASVEVVVFAIEVFARWYGVWFWPVGIASVVIYSLIEGCFCFPDVLDMAFPAFH